MLKVFPRNQDFGDSIDLRSLQLKPFGVRNLWLGRSDLNQDLSSNHEPQSSSEAGEQTKRREQESLHQLHPHFLD